jgi:hypothetical protein
MLAPAGRRRDRLVVTSLEGSAQHLYENVYCQRGQIENFDQGRLIKIGARVIDHIARIRVAPSRSA